MNLIAKPRRRRRTQVTVAGPYAAKQVLNKSLWQEGRAKIAAAALPLFVRHGYHATPVRAIAMAAGLSVGSIFNYFPDKDEILQYILDESQAQAEKAVAETQGRLEAANRQSDPVQLFVEVYRRFVESIDSIRQFTLLAYQETKSLTPQKRAPLLDREMRIAELLKRTAQPAIKIGTFSNDMIDLKVQSLIILGHAWAVRRWALTAYATVGDYFADLEKVAFAIMAARRKGA